MRRASDWMPEMSFYHIYNEINWMIGIQSGVPMDVAVKTCKLIEDEDEVAEKFMKEACK